MLMLLVTYIYILLKKDLTFFSYNVILKRFRLFLEIQFTLDVLHDAAVAQG